MLLTCPSCNSKYLLNSADLKPNGRTVGCAKCGFEWFQESIIVDEDDLITSTSNTFSEEQSDKREELSFHSNLPSTYVKNEKPSVINSFLVMFFLALGVVIFWLIKKEGIGITALINFYIQEFYFNLKLIINDFAKIIHQIIN